MSTSRSEQGAQAVLNLDYIWDDEEAAGDTQGFKLYLAGDSDAEEAADTTGADATGADADPGPSRDAGSGPSAPSPAFSLSSDPAMDKILGIDRSRGTSRAPSPALATLQSLQPSGDDSSS